MTTLEFKVVQGRYCLRYLKYTLDLNYFVQSVVLKQGINIQEVLQLNIGWELRGNFSARYCSWFKQPTGAGITGSRVRVGCSSDSTVNSSSLGVQKWWNTSYSQLYSTPIVYVHKVWNPIFQVNILTWLTSFNNRQLFLIIISHYMSFCQNKKGDIWPKLPYLPTLYCHQLESMLRKMNTSAYFCTLSIYNLNSW